MGTRRALDSRYESIADEVHGGHLAGRLVPSAALAELSLDEGLEVQLAVLDRLVADGEELGGWKVGMTSGPSLDRMGKGFRPFGFILKRRIRQSGSSVRLGQLGPSEIEPELGFRIERPLRGSDLTVAQVREAVSGAIPSFELLTTRLQGSFGNGATVADDLTQWGLVVGEPSKWQDDVAGMEVSLVHEGDAAIEAGPNYAIDDPFRSLIALCATLDRFGVGLEPGQHVITGAFHRTRLLPGKWSAQFKGVGAVEITCE
jgi:2-keto-4-pentenoate hydratase